MEIVGQHSGVAPLTSEQMLHWGEPANSDSTQQAVYQFVDLDEDAQLDCRNLLPGDSAVCRESGPGNGGWLLETFC